MRDRRRAGDGARGRLDAENVGGVPVQKSPGDQIGWGGFAMKIGLAMAPEYWTTDGSGDPAKKIPTNIGDVAVKQAGVAEDTADFIAKGGLWVDKKPYENYKHLEKIGYGKPRGRVRMFIDEFAEVGHSPLPIWAPRWHESTGSFKFSLLITRAPWIMHADPNFVNNPVLREMNTRVHMDAVWMNPNAAAKLGLKEGDEIEVMIINVDRKNRSISLSLKAKESAETADALQRMQAESGAATGTTNLGALLRAKLDSSGDDN